MRKNTPQRTLEFERLERRDLLTGDLLTGIGALGDSLTAEQQFVGSRPNARGFIEQLAETRGLNFGEFDPARPGLQRAGYDYNWAVGSQGVFGAISTGHVDGLAQQISAGEVTLAIVNLASIDLIVKYQAIYAGILSGAALDDYITDIADTLFDIIGTLEEAGTAGIVIGNGADFAVTFSVRDNPAFSDPVGRQRATDAVVQLNEEIQAFADARGYPVVDIFDWTNLGPAGVTVGGVALDGDTYQAAVPNPTHFFEDSQHPGTVAHGLFANALLDAIRQAYGVDVAPLTDQEILINAGLTPPGAGPTYYDISELVEYNHAPVADAGGTYWVVPGEPAVVSAEGSFDPENGTNGLTFEWDLDADGEFEAEGRDLAIDTTTLHPGTTVTVSVRVIDARGRATIDEATLHVAGASLVDGVLTVNGSQGRDFVRIRPGPNRQLLAALRIDQGSWVFERFARGEVEDVIVNSGDGNDRIKIIRSALGNTVIDTGDGDDRFLALQSSFDNLTLSTGMDRDVVNLLFTNVHSNTSIDLGDGNDRLAALFSNFGGPTGFHGGPGRFDAFNSIFSDYGSEPTLKDFRRILRI